MKHLITVFLFLLLTSCYHVKAQVLVGPVAGGQVSWVSFFDKDNKGLYNVNPVWSFHAGAQVSFRVRKRFFLHTSLLYSQKGKVMKAKQGNDDVDPAFYNKVRYDYIEMPLIYTVEFIRATPGGKTFKWYLGLGPNVSYWLGGKGTLINTELREDHIEEKGYKFGFGRSLNGQIADNEMAIEKANRVQLGLNVSAGVVFEPMQDRKFMLNFRYELGHSYLSRESSGRFSKTVYTEDLRTRNQGLRISLAYLIDLKVDQRKRGKSTNDPKKRRY